MAAVIRPKTEREWSNLCEKVKDLVPHEIGEEAWYVILAAILVASPDPDLLATFYTHLTTKHDSFSSEQCVQRLSMRLRDVLFKTITLVGMPRVLCVLAPLAKAEGDTLRKSQASTLTEKWHPNRMNIQETHDRGVATAHTIYGTTLLPQIFSHWGSHKEDMKFQEFFTAYGLYLSDFEILTPLETEAMVYATISCLGLKGPGLWHLRGMGRLLGLKGSKAQTENYDSFKSMESRLLKLKEAVIMGVEFVGQKFVEAARVREWADIEDVMKDLNGWGNDDEAIDL